MWIRLSQNTNDVSCDMQSMTKEEFIEFAKDKEKAMKFITAAYKSAEAIWKVHPEFKSITLDTLSKEEIDMIEQVKNLNVKN